MFSGIRCRVCCVALLNVLPVLVGCLPSELVDELAGKKAAKAPVAEAPPGPPVPPPAPQSPAAGLVTSEVQAPSGLTESATASPTQPAVESPPSSSSAPPAGVSVLDFLTTDEGQVRRLFEDNVAALQSRDGKFILSRCPPEQRSALVLGMLQFDFWLLGPDSEVGRMVAEAGLYAEKYKPLFSERRDGKPFPPELQALADEAVGRLRDPERIVSLVQTALLAQMPETVYELIHLTIDGDEATGVQLAVTHFGTSPNPFSARKTDGKWRSTYPTPAALAKVRAYEADPTPATVKLPPRKQVHLTAAQLSAEFQSDPTGAAQRYSGPFGGPSFSPFGPGGPGSFGGPPSHPGPQGLIIPAVPKIRDYDIVVEGTIAFCQITDIGPVIYLVTPAGSHRVNMTVGSENPLKKIAAAAQTGQKLIAVVDGAYLMTSQSGEPGMVGLSSRKFEIAGEPAKSHGPLTPAEFLREIGDPTLAEKNQARPIVVQGTVEFLTAQSPFVTLGDGAGNRVMCIVDESQVKRLRSIRRGHEIALRGVYVPPTGRNQLLLHACILEEPLEPARAP